MSGCERTSEVRKEEDRRLGRAEGCSRSVKMLGGHSRYGEGSGAPGLQRCAGVGGGGNVGGRGEVGGSGGVREAARLAED